MWWRTACNPPPGPPAPDPPAPQSVPRRCPPGVRPVRGLTGGAGVFTAPGTKAVLRACLGPLRPRAASSNQTYGKGEMLLSKFEPIDARTLSITPLPPVRWMIPELLPAGLTLLAGASKAGKSWLCLWLCLQLAKGGELWGRPLRAQAVLYLCLEDTYSRIQNRLFRLSEEEMPDNLYFQTVCEGLGHGLEEQIEQFLAVRPDTGLVVIDTLQKVRTSDANGNVYACDYRDMSALKSLADRHNIGILLVHHQRKDRTDDPFDDISGSVALMGGADTSWVLRRRRMSLNAQLHVTGRDMEIRALDLRWEDCRWELEQEETSEELARKAVPACV